VCVIERESVCVCVIERAREKERERECVCVSERACVCEWVRERESVCDRERESVWVSEWERERERESKSGRAAGRDVLRRNAAVHFKLFTSESHVWLIFNSAIIKKRLCAKTINAVIWTCRCLTSICAFMTIVFFITFLYENKIHAILLYEWYYILVAIVKYILYAKCKLYLICIIFIFYNKQYTE